MENNDKKKLTKQDVMLVVWGSVYIVVFIVLLILIIFFNMRELVWIGDLCACISGFIIGFSSWKKSKLQSIVFFALSARWAIMSIIGLAKLLF